MERSRFKSCHRWRHVLNAITPLSNPLIVSSATSRIEREESLGFIPERGLKTTRRWLTTKVINVIFVTENLSANPVIPPSGRVRIPPDLVDRNTVGWLSPTDNLVRLVTPLIFVVTVTIDHLPTILQPFAAPSVTASSLD